MLTKCAGGVADVPGASVMSITLRPEIITVIIHSLEPREIAYHNSRGSRQ